MKAKSSSLRVSQLSILGGLSLYSLRSTLRDKGSWFFSFLFPLMFITIFGLIGGSGPKTKMGVSHSVAQNNPIFQTLNKIAVGPNAPLDLSTTGSDEDLEKSLAQSKIDSVLEMTDGSRLKLVTTNGNPSGKAASLTILNGVVSQMNLGAAQATAMHVNSAFVLPFSFSNTDISARTYRFIDYILPGQIGMSLLFLATFGVAFPLLTLRRTLVLKRMFATTVRPLTFVLSQCLTRSVQAMMQATLILVVGIVAFKFNLVHGWVTMIEMLVLALLGVLSFLGIGIFVANIARNEQSVPIALNLFNFPQLFLSGTFFPTDSMPLWVQKIGNNLPLAYLNVALRKVSLEGAPFSAVFPYMLGLFAWSLLAYFLAARTFKTE